MTQISGLALASEVFPGEKGAEVLRMAEGAARFIKENMYDMKPGELYRSWREGKGPRGVAEDYAFLIQGMSCLDCPLFLADPRLL